MNIAIVGCGYIGLKRAKFLGHHRLAAVADVIEERAKQVADEWCRLQPASSGVSTGTTLCPVTICDWQTIAQRPDIDAVLVSTTPDNLARIARMCLENGKHVLVDKPAARNAAELNDVIAAMRRHRRVAKVGFNHRFHPSLQRARQIIDAGDIGPLLYIRGRYGHGGRIGYEKEWRANPDISGGGELLDQGTHLIDLSRWFLGDFPSVSGFAHTYFWNMPVDDNAFIQLRTKDEQTAWLHVSWTEWKNLFCFEIFGRDGKLQIDGLGGSYGTEQLTFYKMKPEMGPPDIQVEQFAGEDRSWALEFQEFIKAIEAHDFGAGPNVEDAKAALEIVDKIYRRSPASADS